MKIKRVKGDCSNPKQTNHLGKISSDLLLWSPLHCLCKSFDKHAVGKLRNRLWNFPAVSSEWVLHRLVQGEASPSPPAGRTGSYRVAVWVPPAPTAQSRPPGSHPSIQGWQQIGLHRPVHSVGAFSASLLSKGSLPTAAATDTEARNR